MTLTKKKMIYDSNAIKNAYYKLYSQIGVKKVEKNRRALLFFGKYQINDK